MELFNAEFVKTIRESSFEMEKRGVMTDEALQFIYEHKLFKLLLPEQAGGRMVGLPDALRIFEAASWVNGSFGWAVTIGTGGNYFYSCFPETTALKLFRDRKAVVAGSGHPSGIARKADGGYVLNGSWKYNSGSPYATIFTATCTIEDPQGHMDGTVRAFVLKPEQVTIVEDWDAFGLRATASHTYTAAEAFVPDELAFDVFNNTFYDHPVYRFPFLPFAESSFAAVAAGIGKHFLEEAAELARRHGEAWSRANPLRTPFVTAKIGEMERALKEQAALFYEAVERAWSRHSAGEAISENEWRDLGAQCKRTAKTAYECGQRIFPYLGLGATMQHTPINQTWRDLQTVCHHSILADFS
ncbi:acyl-CoA dehydrogenase [Paenibacillus thermotolerans]|uniref:acyl-CoA dehydrogenase n=1 Tax=Paenibacillus thermotolerans TaxID=3027807 RepID=UPI00236762D2|nr:MULTISPECIES: acyl-CoA dehydrogenase [unclassified Paenibacillus]